jgi:predicted ATPase
MSKIRIKNFGPIKEGYLEDNGFLDIKKVTVFIGNQGSGKSTVAKVISTMMWLEKALCRGSIKWFDHPEFIKFIAYQGIDSYFNRNSEIEFVGNQYYILRKEFNIQTININKHQFLSPKIIYVPAERNTLSTTSNLKGLSDNMQTFFEEYRRASKELKGKQLKMPINNYSYQYDGKKETGYIVGDDYKIDIKNASSGIQSFAPLFIVANNLANLVTQPDDVLRRNMNANAIFDFNYEMSQLEADNNIDENTKNQKRKEIKDRYLPKCFINIVEEPEQNLYPTSQRHILNSLLEFNNLSEGNKLIMTTHSPYILSYLTLAIKGQQVFEKIQSVSGSEGLVEQLNNIVPIKSLIHPDDLVIYQLDDNGNITKLDNYKELPSDENYLNDGLELTNILFSQLLDLEEICQIS